VNIKRLVILPVLALVAAPIAAHADSVSYTFTGIVTTGFDDIGLFGAPGSETLARAGFTATFDVNLATESINGNFLEIEGGTDSNGSPPSPFISESLTINGLTANFVGGGCRRSSFNPRDSVYRPISGSQQQQLEFFAVQLER
jgi:hypothetical protein